MNFRSLPLKAPDILAMEWADYEPYYEDLRSRDLDSDSVSSWLEDWSLLASCVDEQYTRLYIATTTDTADAAIASAYGRFIESLQGSAKAADQGLKGKLLSSGLEPEGFETALRMMQAESEIFREENLPLLTEEQKLGTEYNKLFGAQTVLWEGEERTNSQMVEILAGTDRAKRELAWRLLFERRWRDRPAINGLWGEFMALRTRIANNAAQRDYRAYVWKQKFRFDYGPEDCKSFDAAIEKVVVPAAARVYAKRRARLGLDSLRPWDLQVDQFGNEPLRPYESLDEFQSKMRAIFARLDPVFGERFQAMRDEGLLDIATRRNKAPGAYSLGLHRSRRPFVFMSNTATNDDVDTLLHEGGHAFHEFERASLNFFQKGEIYLPAEFAEVASMAMELLAAPYLLKSEGGFYTEAEAARAIIDHLDGILTFWPYMALVDSFQHWVYENPGEASSGLNCEAKWSLLWDRFMPGIDYSGFEDAKKTHWQRQLHIHLLPFYYIEYGLAQYGAVQVWANSLEDERKAVADYRHALSLGKTVPLPELFRAAGAELSFGAEGLEKAVSLIERKTAELERNLG